MKHKNWYGLLLLGLSSFVLFFAYMPILEMHKG